MRNPFRQRTDEDAVRDRMFETRSHAWERVGLAQQLNQQFNPRAIRKARRQAAVLLPLLAGVIAVVHYRQQLFGTNVPVRIAAAIAMVVLGWAFARDVGRAVAPTFFRRMDPSTAGTVGFLIRLATIVSALLEALSILQVKGQTLALGGSITAVVLGLAAQQTLGNLFAGMVLLSARPFRVGERVRLQAGQLGGPIDGVVSTLGLLYTTLARGEDMVMIPNNVVLSSVVVPVREPDAVDVTVRLHSGIRATAIQAILDENISTPTRREPRVLLQEINGDEVVVRVQATPERADDGATLADQIMAAIASVTGEHEATRQRDSAGEHEAATAASTAGRG